MHISQKLSEGLRSNKPTISFEYFPPKTEKGLENLYGRIGQMNEMGPSFVDVTWGAGGSTTNKLTNELVEVFQSKLGIDTCMHLTCTNMTITDIDAALDAAYAAGCTNILALRGDPPKDSLEWEQGTSQFCYAKDLVRHIRRRFADHFDIGVAGYSEGCDDNSDVDLLIDHLKEKVDAGATFVVTQMFYNAEIFLDWARKCRAKGISVPILPGIMPVANYDSFYRRVKWTKSDVPQVWKDALEQARNDNEVFRQVGAKLVAQMCRDLLQSGLIHHLHFYTMNFSRPTEMVLVELGLIKQPSHEVVPVPIKEVISSQPEPRKVSVGAIAA